MKKTKRLASIALSSLFLLPAVFSLTGCGEKADVTLRVFSWEEYIDEGGEGSYAYDMLADGEELEDEDMSSMVKRFEKWYEKEYHETVRVKYSTFGTNEDMYNKLLLGKEYDLLCPSDYMIMKLAAENRIIPYDEEFFDPAIEKNYYVRNVSPYIQGVFEEGKVAVPDKETGESPLRSWSEYAAGYMWGTTGLVYNPEDVDETELKELGYNAFIHPGYKNKITTKDNVRDTYFAALGLTYQSDLLEEIKNGNFGAVTEIFNRTDADTVAEVYKKLMEMKKNIYGFETDTGKADLVSGKIWLNYAWSGDAVYAMDLAENEDETLLNYYVPDAGSNLWFDGWVMTRSVEKRGTKKAAQAFVNFLSMPENAKRNSYYIGYTSVIAGEEQEMLEYADYLYGIEEEEEENYYDLSYFFYTPEEIAQGETAFIYAEEDQRLRRQLYAQFPPEEVIERCAVMNYFDPDTNERINELWAKVKAESLDAWAITVICVAVVAIALFIVFVKFGDKFDFFHRKPKKGYTLVDQRPAK